MIASLMPRDLRPVRENRNGDTNCREQSNERSSDFGESVSFPVKFGAACFEIGYIFFQAANVFSNGPELFENDAAFHGPVWHHLFLSSLRLRKSSNSCLISATLFARTSIFEPRS